MKKIISFVLLVCLSISLIFAVGCGATNWKESDVTLKDWGAVVSQHGYVAETENYVYFINGVASSSGDNTFGMPIKGALMVADKNDLSKSEEVVPKLFTGADATSGMYIKGDYVYYGTPSTDKTPTGSIAFTTVEFMRTKLDGTGTQKYFKVSETDLLYRFTEDADGNVYVVYYDSEATSLKSYNFTTGATVVLAKTDEKCEERSLDEYKFISYPAADPNAINPIAVIFSVKVYKPYDEDAAKLDSYTREEKNYNEMYVYKVGDTQANDEVVGKMVLNGNVNPAKPTKYSITSIYEDNVFYTATDNNSNSTYFKATMAQLYNGGQKTQLEDIKFSGETVVYISDDEVYTLDADTKYVVLTSMIKANRVSIEKPVAKGDNINAFLFKHGDYIYYYNKSEMVCRVKVANVDVDNEEDLSEQRISNYESPNTWYLPVIVDNQYLFYCNSNSKGGSYTYYTDLNAEIKTKDITTTDEDTDTSTTTTIYYVDGAHFIGKRTVEDLATIASAYISSVSDDMVESRLVFDTKVGDVDTMQAVVDARAFYDSISDKAKESVSDTNKKLLISYEEALRLSRKFMALDRFTSKSDAEKDALKNVYEDCKREVEALKNSTVYNYATVRDLMVGNCVANYQHAKTYFEAN